MVWIKSGKQPKFFTNGINKKTSLYKIVFKFSKEKIEFLDTLVYKNHNDRLQATLYEKLIDPQNYLQARSAHRLH